MISAEVRLWGTRIGYVTQETTTSPAKFIYDEKFARSGIQISPITMPLSLNEYVFPNLSERTFKGLPGLLSDSLPDKFGTTLIDEYLARQGRTSESFSSVERLCYIGNRGMGALEFIPQIGIEPSDQSINIDDLSKLADEILSAKKRMVITADERAVGQLIKIGTSAGGARAKALIAWNEETGEIRSGQIEAGNGFGYWLLKFGTVENNKDKDTESDPVEYPNIEYAYSLMAKDAGIDMTECRLIKSKEGVHFATKRFDREENSGKKIHMLSLGGLAHFDFNDPGAHGYEEVISIFKKLNLSHKDTEQLFKRMIFNEVAKNYDDHVKNISFLMDRTGTWRLAPAYDMTFSYNPASIWTASHQMKINGKRDNLEITDLVAAGKNMGLSDKTIESAMQSIIATVRKWPEYAEVVKLDEVTMNSIKMFHKYSHYYPDAFITSPMLERIKNANSPYSEVARKQ